MIAKGVEAIRAVAAGSGIPDLELKAAGKAFQGKVVLKDVSLSVARGEFLAILGPSGSGKSTLLKVIAGFEEADTGSIRLRGQDVTRVPPYDRNVNTVFQNYALFQHMSVFENVAYGLRRRKVAAPEIQRRVQDALTLVDLGAFGGRSPGTLSGGEQQRVAIARALVNQPAVLLLDEPLSALDLKIRRRMQVELKRIHEEVGTTFIYVTHDQEEAMSLGHRVVVMRSGAIEQIGTGRDLYDSPNSHFVADFIGETNWAQADVTAVAGGIAVVSVADGMIVRAPAGPDLRVGSRVEIGIRPERLRLLREGDVDGSVNNTVAGRVERIIFQGASLTIEVRLPNGLSWHYVRQTDGRSPDADALLVGADVRLAWDVAATFLFEGAELRAAGQSKRTFSPSCSVGS